MHERGSVRAAATPDNLLLVTIDTIRADRVGIYGHAAARTGVLDGLARSGVRFTQAYSAAPITLTSHATLMTGLNPPSHGARHNGMRVRDDTPTLGAAFAAAGFKTAAFVSAFPLNPRFGLARGFTTYDAALPRQEDGGRSTSGRMRRPRMRPSCGFGQTETRASFFGCTSSARTRRTGMRATRRRRCSSDTT